MVLGRDKLSHVRGIPGINDANPIELKAGRDETCGKNWRDKSSHLLKGVRPR
jgi:hypothetical protein